MVQTKGDEAMKRLEIERKILQCVHQMQDQMLPEVLQYLERLSSQEIRPVKRFNTAQVQQVVLMSRDELHER